MESALESEITNNAKEIAQLLMKLFVHRSDVWAQQKPDGSYEKREEPLTLEILEAHVRGEVTVGCYQALNNTVKWLAFDIDGDNKESVRACAHALYDTVVGHVPKESVIVTDSGRKGNHIIIFFAEPVPIAFARNFGLKIAKETKIPDTVTGVRVEIFPKQSHIPEGGFGNLMKLALGIHQVTRRRVFVVSPETLEPVSWTELRKAMPWSLGRIADEMVKTEEETEKMPLVVEDYPCWIKISEGDIPEGMRHDVALAFASHLRDRGLSHNIAVIVAREWWKRLPQPPDAKTYIRWEDVKRAVDDTYKRGYHVGCKLIRSRWPELCSPDCPIYRKQALPILFPQKMRENVAELCNGEYILETHGIHTVLYSPLGGVSITMRGKYVNWSPSNWRRFARRASNVFRNAELDKELSKIMERYISEWVKSEVKVINDDAETQPTFYAEHTIEVRYSEKNNYIKISGDTYRYRTILREFMDWDPKTKSWYSEYSQSNYRRAVDFAQRYDTRSDPVLLGKVRCWICGSWVPKDQAKRTKHGWSCGCISRMKKEKSGGGV